MIVPIRNDLDYCLLQSGCDNQTQKIFKSTIQNPQFSPQLQSPIYLYNMLQDFRHLLIFDLRSSKDYQQFYIRDSFNVSEQISKGIFVIKQTIDKISSVIELAQQKATEKQTKYKQLKRVRRYFLVGGQKLPQDDKKVKQVLECLQKHKSKDDKVYALDCGMEQFFKKYPFVCLSREQNEQIALRKQQHKQQQSDKILLYPYCKFPSQIIADKVYLGNIYSSNSQKQLEDLGIQCLIDFVQYNQDQKVPQFKQAKYNYLHLPFNSDTQVLIDFDVICQEIEKHVAKGKTLFYCKDGEVISPAFVIAYLMYKCKLDINMATLKVCQAISRVEICKWIYTQLLTYKPKK